MDAKAILDFECPGKRVMILGVGNTLRGDDGIGPALVRDLKGKVRCGLLDCGEAPENYLQKIIDHAPDVILVVDAADWGGVPGEIRPISPEEISNPSCSGHNSSLHLSLDYLKAHLGARILIFGIQTRKREFLDPISPEARRALKTLEDWFLDLFPPEGWETEVA